MKRLILFTVLLLVSLSAVSAVNVATSKIGYNSGETVTATISQCQGTSIVKFLNPGGTLVDIKSGQNNWQTSYNTLSDSADGKYTVTVSCNNGEADNNFCVDDPACVQEVQLEQNKTNKGLSCTPQWDCSVWSFCGPDKTQTRSCTDTKNCKPAMTETRSCAACQESWVCSLWGECNTGSQSRVCYDEHFCETAASKPGLQKGCNEADPFPPPAKISSQLPPPFTGITQAPEEGFFSKLWAGYKLYLIAGLVALILAALAIAAVYYFRSPKVAYNINELKQWVRKEKQMGTADEDIRQILKQNTGWTSEEIELAFDSSRKPSKMGSGKASAV